MFFLAGLKLLMCGIKSRIRAWLTPKLKAIIMLLQYPVTSLGFRAMFPTLFYSALWNNLLTIKRPMDNKKTN